MENITFDFAELHLHGPAFYEFLQLRKHFFVDVLNWDVPNNGLVEMDQYDNPLAFYSLVVREGKVIGGARAMPTTSRWGDTTYMLRDAALGKLPDIPNNVLKDEIVTTKVWECTRLVISEEITAQKDRAECLSLVVGGLIDIAAKRGADQLISLSPVLLRRTLRQLGYAATQIGETYSDADDRRKYAVLSLDTGSSIYASVAA